MPDGILNGLSGKESGIDLPKALGAIAVDD